MPCRIGITGSPKTGKTEIGRKLAEFLNYPFYDLNQLCIDERLGHYRGEEFVVNLEKARKFISDKLAKEKRYVISGLLLPDLIASRLVDIVVVLRCNPKILYERYKRAGYSEYKAKSNATAEAIGVVHYDSLKAYGDKVKQIDVTRLDSKEAAESIMHERFSENVDWLDEAEKDEELLKLLL